MAYRNKVYICFGADEDMRYYNLCKAWKQSDNTEFNFHDAHDLNNLLPSSNEETIKAKLRERLKNTHRNALDMINKLGLSDTVMKLINSRNRQDRKIIIGGFVGLFVLFYLCMRWRG